MSDYNEDRLRQLEEAWRARDTAILILALVSAVGLLVWWLVQ